MSIYVQYLSIQCDKCDLEFDTDVNPQFNESVPDGFYPLSIVFERARANGWSVDRVGEWCADCSAGIEKEKS